MSQYDLIEQIILNYEKQIAIMKAQLLRLMELKRKEEIVSRSNTKSNVKMAISQTCDGSSEKVRDFVTAYKLYLRMRIREATVEKQVQ